MKKVFFTGLFLLCMMIVLSSCGMAKRNTSPGSVIGSAASSQKVVKFEVIGKGLEPETALTKGEAVLMAERAAVSDGYRQLVEKIRGVYVEAFTKSGNGTVDYDLINTQTQSWLRGVRLLEVTRGEHGITQARMQLRVYFAKRDMVWWPTGIGDGAYVKEGLFSSGIAQ